MSSDFYKIFEELSDMLEDAMKLPLSKSKYIINGDQMRDLLDELKENLPEEIKKSQEIIDTKEKMLSSAKEDSDAMMEKVKAAAEQALVRAKSKSEAIIERAQAQAETLVNEQQILIVAKERAAEIVETAKNDAVKMRTVTVNYVNDVLDSAQKNLQTALTSVNQAKKAYEPKQ